MSVVSLARRGRLAVLSLALVAGCGSTTGPTGRPDSPAAGASQPGAGGTPLVTPGSASPTPIAGLTPAAVPLDEILLVCESWGSEPPPGIVGCREAASLALAAIGPGGAGGVGRLDVGSGEPCLATPCPGGDPDTAWVLVSRRDGEPPAVRVARDPNGGLAAWPPTPGRPLAEPSFRPPAPAAPDLGPDAPPGVRDRPPLAFCGDEDLGPTSRYDTPARRCFVDGILAGVPVELISHAPSTEGDPVVTLYRWTGRGSVRRAVRTGGQWSLSVCAITPLATDAAFVLAGGCDPVDP
jgi:hypothetical protein